MSQDEVSRKSIFFFLLIVFVMLSSLWYGFSIVKQEPIPSPSTNDGQMSEECKKIWLEQGELAAEKAGC